MSKRTVRPEQFCQCSFFAPWRSRSRLLGLVRGQDLTLPEGPTLSQHPQMRYRPKCPALAHKLTKGPNLSTPNTGTGNSPFVLPIWRAFGKNSPKLKGFSKIFQVLIETEIEQPKAVDCGDVNETTYHTEIDLDKKTKKIDF